MTTATENDPAALKALMDEVSSQLDKRDSALSKTIETQVKSIEASVAKMQAEWLARAASFSLPGSNDATHKGEKYSFRKACLALITNRPNLAPLEYEMSEQVRTKAMSFGIDTAGGFLVPSEVMTGEIIPKLYAESVAKQLGAREWTGLTRAPLYVPRIAGGVTAQWLGEGATGTASDLRIEQMKLEPHKLMALTAMSEELLTLDNSSVEASIREDMTLAFAEKLDLAALKGTGASGEPIGVRTATGIGTSTLTDPTTYNELLAFISTVRGNNGLRGSLGWALSNADMLEIEQMVDASSGGTNTTNQTLERRRLLSEDGTRMLGYPHKVSTQLADGDVIFGNWNDLVIAQWGGMQLAFTNAVGFTSGQAHIRMISMFDIGIRNPKSFCRPA